MRPGRRTTGCFTAALSLLWLSLPAAHAQSRRYPPEPVDFDEEAEDKSVLWEQVVDPNRDRYYASVDRARELLDRRNDQVLPEVEDLLARAIALSPDNPRAHWLVGQLEERRENWHACATAYERVFAMAPGYQPIDQVVSGRNSRWALDYALASCHARAGDYERAIAHYKRILSRGHSEEAAVHRSLGSAYMALGRLADAIASFSTALRYQPKNVRTSYDLAVAYDRDEKAALSAEYLEEASKLDRDLSALKAPDQVFVPPADELYYLGLASAGRGRVEWAVWYFRQHLHVAGKSPWASRVRHHLHDLSRKPLDSARIRQTGTHAVDPDKLVAVIARVQPELQACLSATPGLLLEVTITVTGRPARPRARGRRSRPGGLGPAPGVSAMVAHSFATEPDQAAKVRHCVETAAEQIQLPTPSRRSGRYLSVKFPVIAR